MLTDLLWARQLLAVLFITVLVTCSFTTEAQCLNPELALINSCIEHPNPNGGPLDVESEILVVSSGIVEVPVNSIRVDLPFNGLGPENGDISESTAGDCRFKEPTVTTLPGCPNAVALGPNDVIPPNAFVVIFVNGITVTNDVIGTDFSNLCQLGATIYILQSACERTAGAFVNEFNGGDPLRTIGVTSPCGPRIFTYNTQSLDPSDGTYYLVGSNTTGNLNCDLPEIPETCPSIDTTYFICDPAGTMATIPATEFDAVYDQTQVSTSFHTSPAGAEGNFNQVTLYTPTGIALDTLWARITYASNFCVVVSPLVIRYQMIPATTNPPAGPAVGCDPNFIGVGLFDLRRMDAEIGGGQPVTYYTDMAATNEILDPSAFTSVPITIFARAGIGTCESLVVPVNLELDNSPFVDPMSTETSCPENADGTITVNATGAAPFQYAWAGDSLPNSGTLTGLPAGTYNVTVTNANGCSVDRDIVVTDGQPPRVNCSLEAGTSGPGAMDGRVRLEIAEGVRPYEVTYTGPVAGSLTVNGAVGMVFGLGGGFYDFVVTDADGCVSEVCQVEVSETVPIELLCRVRNNSDGGTVLGAIISTINDGIAPFLVQITDESNNTTDFPGRLNGEILFDNLPVGQYTITVTGADGAVERCVLSIVQVVCPLTISDIQQFPVDCQGSDLVIVSIVGSGANGMISTTWMGPNNVELFNDMQDAGPLPPGTYFVSISDQSGCPPVDPGPIIVGNPGPPIYEVNTNGISANCTPTGFIDVTIQGGGTPPYTVHLVDASNDMELATITNREPGDIEAFFDLAGAPSGPNYYVYLSDQINCSSDTSFVSIIGSVGPALELLPADQQFAPPICAGDSTGTITLSAGGGTAPYTYRWLDYPQRASGRVLPDGATQIDLPAGAYVVEVADMGACVDTFTVNLGDGTAPILACGPVINGVGTTAGSVTVDITGTGTAPYELTLTRGVTDAMTPNLPAGTSQIGNLGSGNYVGVVRDANGCISAPCSFTVDAAPCALASSAIIDSVDCTGQGQIAVTLTNATIPNPTFDWVDPNLPDLATVTVTTAGTYPVVIDGGNGCSLDTFFTVFAEDDGPTMIVAPRIINRICYDETFVLPLIFAGQGPFDLVYLLEPMSGGTPTPGMAQFGNVEDTLRLNLPDLPTDSVTLRLQSISDSRCSRDIQDVLVNLFFERPDTVRRLDVTCDPSPVMIGGRIFDAMNPSDTFLVADGSTRCGIVYEVDLTFQTGSADIPDTLEVFICAGTDYTPPGTTEIFNAGRPEGDVRYTRPGACDSVVYIRLDIPEVTLGSYSEGGFCVGDTLFFGDRFFTADSPSGLARLTGEAADGCDSLVIVTGSFRRVGDLRLFGDFSICPGDSIDLRFTYDGPGGIDAVLEDSQGNRYDLPGVRDNDRFRLFPTESTAYRIVSAMAANCPGEFAGGSTVTVNDLAIVTEVLLDPVTICADTLGRVVVTPSGGTAPYTYVWSNGPTDSLNRNLLGGTYAVTVADAEGCIRVDSVSISDRAGLIVDLSVEPPACDGDFGTLVVDTIFGGGGFYEVSIDGEFFLPVERIGDFNPPPGLGTAIFQDVDDCTVTIDFFVPLAVEPIINLLEDTTIRLGDSILLDPRLTVDFDTAFWTPPVGLRTPGQAVTIAAPGSSSEYRFTLRTTDGCEFIHFVGINVDERSPVFAPTAFSPNGDDVNETYELRFGPQVAELTSFQIFNRWGNLMHNQLESWDGMIAGQRAPSAVYVFQAVVILVDGTERYIKGDFVLMR